jgi:hypothetical protein
MFKKSLQELSRNAIAFNAEHYSEAERRANWIGRTPATAKAIKAAQARIGVILPSDVVQLYKASNGTSVILNQTFGGFMPIETIDWLKNIQPNTLSDYAEMGEEYVETLKNCILISGIDYPHQVFIIQPYGKYQEWRYWEFAAYIPGENAFAGIEQYLERLNDFLLDQIKNKAETEASNKEKT